MEGQRVYRENDKLVWVGKKDGKSSIKGLCKEVKLGREVNFQTNVIRKSWVSPKVGVFAWEATWSKILTLDNV